MRFQTKTQLVWKCLRGLTEQSRPNKRVQRHTAEDGNANRSVGGGGRGGQRTKKEKTALHGGSEVPTLAL